MNINIRNPRLVSAFWKSLSGIHWLTLSILTLRVSSYFAGLHEERIVSLLSPVIELGADYDLFPPAPSESTPQPDVTGPAALAWELETRIRKLYEHIGTIEREIRERKVHFNLLQSQGYADDSSEILNATDRLANLESRMKSSREEVAEATDLQERLLAAISASEQEAVASGVDLKLRRQVLRAVHRERDGLDLSPRIPDTIWEEHP